MRLRTRVRCTLLGDIRIVMARRPGELTSPYRALVHSPLQTIDFSVPVAGLRLQYGFGPPALFGTGSDGTGVPSLEADSHRRVAPGATRARPPAGRFSPDH